MLPGTTPTTMHDLIYSKGNRTINGIQDISTSSGYHGEMPELDRYDGTNYYFEEYPEYKKPRTSDMNPTINIPFLE